VEDKMKFRLLLALLLALTMTMGVTLLACDDDDDDDDNDDEADDGEADDDDTTDDDTTDDDTTDDDDDDDTIDDDDDDDTIDCPALTEGEAEKFFWAGEPPLMGGQTLIAGIEAYGHQILGVAGVIAMHGLKVDQLQWTIIDPDDSLLGAHDLKIPDGGTIDDGDPNMYVAMIYNASVTGTYDEMWVSVSGCVQIDEIGWVGETFTGSLENVIFRKVTNETTGELDWAGPVGFMGSWTASGTVIAQ